VLAAASNSQKVRVEAGNATTAEHVPNAIHAQRNQVHDHVGWQTLVLNHLVIPAGN